MLNHSSRTEPILQVFFPKFFYFIQLFKLQFSSEMKCYGTEEAEHIGHVFHVNIALPEATQCNDDQTAFFRQYL